VFPITIISRGVESAGGQELTTDESDISKSQPERTYDFLAESRKVSDALPDPYEYDALGRTKSGREEVLEEETAGRGERVGEEEG
jgi:hypothetical protein